MKTLHVYIFALLITAGCQSTPQQPPAPQEKPPRAAADPEGKSIGEQVRDVVDPRTYIGTREVDEAAQVAKSKIDQLDVEAINMLLFDLDELVTNLDERVEAFETQSWSEVARQFEEAVSALSDTLQNVEQKTSEIDASQMNQTLAAIDQTARQFGDAAARLNDLIQQIAALIEATQIEEVRATVTEIRRTSENLQATTAQLPSTTATLSTTIWLLNGLLAIGITLGVIHLLQLRQKPRGSGQR